MTITQSVRDAIIQPAPAQVTRDAGADTAEWPQASRDAYTATQSASSFSAIQEDGGRPSHPLLTVEPTACVLPVPDTLALARRLASAVAELHRRGIVHRDIKPSNLFLCGGAIEQLKLLDLGTAQLRTLEDPLTQPGVLIGTPHYMAPEQARAQGEIEPATDVWAIGCVLYECLTGMRPFTGQSVLTVLTRIVIDEPSPIRHRRSDVPVALESLVMSALRKDVSARPRDAGALERALAELGAATGTASPSSLSPRSLTIAERRVTCLLFVDARDARADDATLSAVVEPWGGRVQRLANGSLFVTLEGTGGPTEQSVRAARCALALRDAFPELRAGLAMGHTDGTSPLGAVVEEAARALAEAQRGTIWVDGSTAALLDPRFIIVRERGSAHLEQARSTEGERTLLGKPSLWVGRQRELATLVATFNECVRERVSRATLVTGQAGMGKSRLRHELEQALLRRREEVTVLRGQGDAVSAGSPFVMIAPAVRRLANVLDGEPAEVRRGKLLARLGEVLPAAELTRVASFLGEMIGVPFPDEDNDSLRAARKDPMLLGQLMQRAWDDWLRAEAQIRPVLVLLEDLHWGDLPSVKFVDGALGTLSESPLMVLALARPEVHGAVPRLWANRALQEIALHGLPAKACATLVRDALGAEVTGETVDSLVQRAGGNAFYLEELIRVVAEKGSTDLPDTILGTVQARLDALGSEARRILRAGSVFGEVFWRGGVERLAGMGGPFDVSEWLQDLVAREVVTREPTARIPGELEYKFRHAIVRDAAYAMLTDEDRRFGHCVAAEWLEQVGERDGLVLAEHFTRGGDEARAIPWYLRAAEQALEGNDLVAVVERAERAILAGAAGPVRGELRALQSIASYWLSDYSGGQRHGLDAVTHLDPGGARWFIAVGSAIVSSARLGDYAGVDDLFARATAAPCAPGAEAEQLICLCRGAFQLIFHGRFAQADEILARIASLQRTSMHVDALTAAQVDHVQGVRAAHIGDVGTFLRHLEGAVASFELAGDTRNVSLERTTVAWCWAELGYIARAAELCEQNLSACKTQNAQQAITYAKVNLGFILAEEPARLEEAVRILDEAIAECREVGNARLEGWARAHLSTARHRRGERADAEREGRVASDLLSVSPGLQSWALAAHARALLALHRPEEAIEPARRAMDTLERLGGLLQGESLPPLVWAQVQRALGARDEARAAIEDAMARLDRRAARLPDPAWRTSFLGLADNRATLEMFADLVRPRGELDSEA